MDHPFDNLGDYGNGFLWSAVLCYREGRDQITNHYITKHVISAIIGDIWGNRPFGGKCQWIGTWTSSHKPKARGVTYFG